jgi:hypothetical protein
MCLSWILYLTAARRTAWGVPEAEFTELSGLYSAAQALLQKARNDAERAHVITVECQEAFKALEAKMRFFRDRYFKLPPLSEGDWAALGFRPKDTHPSLAPEGVPSASFLTRRTRARRSTCAAATRTARAKLGSGDRSCQRLFRDGVFPFPV